MPKTIVIDLDGTIFDSYGKVVPMLNNSYGLNIDYKAMDDAVLQHVVPDLTTAEVCFFFRKTYADGDVQLMDPEIPKYIDLLRKDGYDINIVTATFGCEDDVIRALRDANIKYDKMSFVDFGRPKAEQCEGDMIIDDIISNARSFVDKGKKAILPSCSWNIENGSRLAADGLSGKLFMAESWAEIYKIIKREVAI